MDLEEQLFGPEPELAEPLVETVPEAPTEPVGSEPHPQEPAPAPDMEQQPREPDGRYAPIAALQDERAKRQDLEREIRELRQQRQAQPQSVPDPIDDPNGFYGAVQQEIAAMQAQTRFEMSDFMARQQHGEEAVEKASEWAMQQAASSPAFAAEYMQQPSPMGWIVQQHQKAEQLANYEADPVAWAKGILEKHGQLPTPVAPVVAQAPAQPAPPKSIASAPSSGGTGEVALGDKASFDAVFKD